ncbi:hypothetical protein Pint_25010 [Pistacia integerrima]|uniref:Uncharacterized protein n=1 Tax=Pistacia integerrima TaxID=434235 RepID=A0ACC0YF82_9ROSI|nr:hypothetical protein Pint_25010 [Pistacia integerrima]
MLPTKPLEWWEGGGILGGKDEMVGRTWYLSHVYNSVYMVSSPTLPFSFTTQQRRVSQLEQLFASHAVAGVGLVALGTAVSYPLDTIKLLIQVSLRRKSDEEDVVHGKELVAIALRRKSDEEDVVHNEELTTTGRCVGAADKPWWRSIKFWGLRRLGGVVYWF